MIGAKCLLFRLHSNQRNGFLFKFNSGSCLCVQKAVSTANACRDLGSFFVAFFVGVFFFFSSKAVSIEFAYDFCNVRSVSFSPL